MATVSGLDPVPFFIAGGAEHSANLLRTLAHLATGGAEGVTRPGDLRVSATDVPGTQVRIAPGSAVMLNRKDPGSPESYIARAPAWTYLDIPPTGATGRTDLIGVRIEDPQYDNSIGPPDEEAARNWEYAKPFRIQVNASQLALAKQGKLDLGYPAYFCNYLVLPANTGTVQNSMLYSLRRLVKPGFKSIREMGVPTPEDELTGAASEVGRIWPTYNVNVEVPPWATGASVVATLSSIGHRGGNAQGLMTAVLDTKRAADIGFDLDQSANAGERHTLIVGGKWNDVRDIAGKTVNLHLEARKLLASTNPGYLVTVAGTQVHYDIQFTESILD